jgi:hypothetical protein
MFLVAFAGNEILLQAFGFGGFGLNCEDPASTFGSRGCLKDVLVSINLEGEFVGTFLGHI